MTLTPYREKELLAEKSPSDLFAKAVADIFFDPREASYVFLSSPKDALRVRGTGIVSIAHRDELYERMFGRTQNSV